jgi:DNA primase
MIVSSQKIDVLRKLLGTPDIDRRGINVQFWCPFCKDSNSRKRKLAVRVEDGLAHCWVCGWRARNVSVLAPLLGKRELLTELIQIYGEITRNSESKEEHNVYERKLSLPNDFKLIGSLIERQIRDPDQIACVNYLNSRNVTVDAVWSFRLGVSEEGMFRRRVLFPSFNKGGELNYLTARTISHDIKPKYFNLECDRKSVIFNEIDIDWKKELIIVEGPFDLLSCYNLNATTALGSWLDERYALFENIVLNQTPVLLAFDADANDKSYKVADKLMKYGINVRLINWQNLPSDSDPSSVGSKMFRDLIRSAVGVTSMEATMSRASRALSSVKLGF